MDPNILLNSRLTEKQRAAWRMRYQFGWSLDRMARRLGIARSTACELVQRANRALGLPVRRYIGRQPTGRRSVRPVSLSSAFDC